MTIIRLIGLRYKFEACNNNYRLTFFQFNNHKDMFIIRFIRYLSTGRLTPFLLKVNFFGDPLRISFSKGWHS